MMDDRRPNTFQQTQQKKKAKQVKSATLGTMVLSALLGGFFLFGFFVGKDYVTHLTIYFTLYIFMLASTLITDFTSVLIDVRDNYIILPKPVSDRTVVVARLLHISIHISKLVLPMALPGIIFVWIKYNAWGALVLLLMIIAVYTADHLSDQRLVHFYFKGYHAPKIPIYHKLLSNNIRHTYLRQLPGGAATG